MVLNEECNEIRRLLDEAYIENSELMKERLAQSNELLSLSDDEIARAKLRNRVNATRLAINASFEEIEKLSHRLRECEARGRGTS